MSSSFLLPIASREDRNNLKSFARGMSLLVTIVFGVLFPWFFDHPTPYWPFGVAVVLMILHVSWVSALYPFYVGWMYVASVLAFINTRLIMFVAYFGLIAPIGIVMRLLGKLQYTKRPFPTNNSYWIKREDSPTSERLKEPF